MFLDALLLLVSEIGGYPGNIGDQCANTSRSEVLNPINTQRLSQFLTPTGFVRSPDAPPGWRESDFSDDQLLPLIMADESIISTARKRLPIKSGNGFLHNPLTFAILWGQHWLANIVLRLQYFLMTKVPWRWDDGKKAFVSTADMTCDWLNWFVTCVYLKRNSIFWYEFDQQDLDLIRSKIYSYYKDEPNNQQILLEYEKGLALFSK